MLEENGLGQVVVAGGPSRKETPTVVQGTGVVGVVQVVRDVVPGGRGGVKGRWFLVSGLVDGVCPRWCGLSSSGLRRATRPSEAFLSNPPVTVLPICQPL